MNLTMAHSIGVIVLAIGIGFLSYFTFAGSDEAADVSDWDCLARENDTDGYLLRICEYLMENGPDVTPGDPRKYNIDQISEGTYKGRAVYEVHLDCCFSGDIAFIDQETGAVIGMDLGDSPYASQSPEGINRQR